jgi:hypothetical protein
MGNTLGCCCRLANSYLLRVRASHLRSLASGGQSRPEALRILRAIDDSRRSNPMNSPDPATRGQTALESQWGDATIEVTHAQSVYAELVSRGAADDETVVAAWLRLWRAQERQRQLSSELDRMLK